MEQNERERHTHPSYGMISFSRVQTTGADFYGSELTQDHYIQMTVKTSEIERTLSQDWYYGKQNVLQLRLSSGQFSELITSLNKGDGVPCTLEYIGGEKVADLPKNESRKEFVHRKFEDRMKEFASRLKSSQNKAKEIVKKKNLSKENMADLIREIDFLSTEVSSNIPFFAKCFQETMDEVVFEAKLEVENAIQHKINILGLEKLHEQNKLLDK